jgi:hypothetical protein
MSVPPFLSSALSLSAWKLVARPVVRLGGALLLGGVLAASVAPSPRAQPSAGGYRLVLETTAQPGCYYGSAWNDGDVVLTHDASDGRTVTLTNRYDYADGCTWEASEVLTPDGDGYRYEYKEHIVECSAEAAVGIACPRVGHVTVVPND